MTKRAGSRDYCVRYTTSAGLLEDLRKSLAEQSLYRSGKRTGSRKGYNVGVSRGRRGE
jgi:hypothetical protein